MKVFYTKLQTNVNVVGFRGKAREWILGFILKIRNAIKKVVEIFQPGPASVGPKNRTNAGSVTKTCTIYEERWSTFIILTYKLWGQGSYINKFTFLCSDDRRHHEGKKQRNQHVLTDSSDREAGKQKEDQGKTTGLCSCLALYNE